MIEAKDSNSTRPYLIRALYEWCTDSGYTPFVAVLVNENVRVPMEFVKDGEIVLNISFDATSALQLGNEYIEFKGRFGGVARDIVIPVDRVLAIYARENGQGMAFPMLAATGSADDGAVSGSKLVPVASIAPAVAATSADDDAPSPKPSGSGRPALTRIK
jgi:stringent starvation protein B